MQLPLVLVGANDAHLFGQLLTELLDLLPQLIDLRHLFVLRGPNLDRFRPICILEGVHCLVQVGQRRGEISNHDRERVAAEALLQNTRKLGVAIGDVLHLALARTLRERGDDAAERAQGLVDADALLHALALRAGLPCALRPGQVHQVDLRPNLPLLPRLRHDVLLLDVDGEDAVRTRAPRVHLRLPCDASSVSLSHVLHEIAARADRQLQQSLNVHA
mmetsp:Transcript_60847/g.175285  ORF Transcript_60847/g.175285 Transcript_60847/m.175285 type:complete len:218 (+) Transcript_60847:2025-2678(+)